MNFIKSKRVLGFLVPILFTVSTAMASFDVNLRLGQKGPEVTKMQKFFVQKNLLITTNFGIFGPLTLKAVKTYQKNNSLPTTGYVGPMTRQKMNAEFGGTGSANIDNSTNNFVATSTSGQQTGQTNQNNITPSISNPLQSELSVSNSNVKVGNIVEVELKITSNPGNPIYTAGATITYDPKILTYEDSTLDSNWIALSQDDYWSTDLINGKIVRTAGFTGGFSGTQTFIKFKFKAISTGDTKINLASGMALDIQNNDVGVQATTMTVTVR